MTTHQVAQLADLKSLGDYVMLPDRGLVMICPMCGNWFELAGPRCYPHRILSANPLSVIPSVVCPWRGCHYIVSNGNC